MNHVEPQSHHIKYDKMYQFQLPSTSSSTKFPGVDGINLYLVSKQIRPVFMRFTTAKSAFLQAAI